MDENDLIYSKHSKFVTRNDEAVRVEIYSSGNDDWILEVVDKDDNSTVWNDPFKTDDDAYDEFKRTLEAEGIESMIGLED